MPIGNEERILRGGVLVWLNDTLAAHRLVDSRLVLAFLYESAVSALLQRNQYLHW